MKRKLLVGIFLGLILLGALVGGRTIQADARSTDTAVDFVKAVQAGNIANAKELLDDEKRRSIPRGGDDTYFQPGSGQTPNLGFLVGAELTLGTPVITQSMKDSFCLIPLDCGESNMVEVPLTINNPPPAKTITLNLYLTREGPWHPWKIHHFSLEPAVPQRSILTK